MSEFYGNFWFLMHKNSGNLNVCEYIFYKNNRVNRLKNLFKFYNLEKLYFTKKIKEVFEKPLKKICTRPGVKPWSTIWAKIKHLRPKWLSD